MRKRNFYESLRNTFFRYALTPIMILVMLWGAGTLVYNLITVQFNTYNAEKEISQVLNQQYDAYSEMLNHASENQRLLDAMTGRTGLEEVNALLYQFTASQDIGSLFYLFGSDGRLLASNTWSERENHKLNADYTITEHFNRSFAAEISTAASGIISKKYYRETQGQRNCIYAMASAVYDQGELAGYLVFEWLQADIMKFIDTQSISYLIITDEYYYAVVSSDDRILNPLAKFKPDRRGSGMITLNGTLMYMVSSEAEQRPFIVFAITTLKSTQQMLVFGVSFIVVTALLLIIIMLQLSKKVAQKNMAHLDELITAVEAMQNGNYSYQLKEDSSHDEFEYLSAQYRQLVMQISNLLELNQNLSDRNRIAEIKQLQAQFHPHLIFNVLENIKYMIYIKPEKAETMISLLANLLRYSIRNAQDMVTLAQDIEYIKAYLELQKERYDSRLTYSIAIPDEMMEIRMPKLILQPLVENCINHGYHNKDTLDIKLTGSIADNRVMLTVTDDGDGITAERLEQIRRTLADPDADTINIGLLNSHRRLQLIYGAEYGLRIDSVEAAGTKVTAVIPRGESYA